MSILCAVAFVLGGCASTDLPQTQANGSQAGENVFRPDPQRVRSMLVNDENGIEVRQLVIADDPDRIAAALAPWVQAERHAGSARFIDRRTESQLHRNGFRLIRVPVDKLDELIDELGGTVLDMASWHGQMYRWHDLHGLPIGSSGLTMAVDGRVKQYRGGDLRLTARSWLVQMEHGPRVQLDIVPQHVRSQSQYHRLLGQESRDSEPLASLAMHMMLKPGYAYILTCECPQRNWEAQVARTEAERGQRDEQSRRRVGPVMMGPDVSAPMTIGQLMLTSHGGRANRGMLVFTPRISSELFPPGDPLSVQTQQVERRP